MSDRIKLYESRTIEVGVSDLAACPICGAVLFANPEQSEGPSINTVLQHEVWHLANGESDEDD